jgi:dihydroorotate dehydrogenase (fumarate)
MEGMSLALQDAGADALVLFNRFYQPDFDVSRLRTLNDLTLSEPNELRVPLLWLAVLAGWVKASRAAGTGVLLAGLESWLWAREFASLDQVWGLMSQSKLRDPQAIKRANYVKILRRYV